MGISPLVLAVKGDMPFYHRKGRHSTIEENPGGLGVERRGLTAMYFGEGSIRVRAHHAPAVLCKIRGRYYSLWHNRHTWPNCDSLESVSLEWFSSCIQ